MGYIDKDYVLTKIKQSDLNELTKDDEGEVQEEYLTDAIETASGLVDDWIKGSVELPLKDIPEMVKQCTYYIAMHFLHDRVQSIDIPERVQKNYDNALEYLKSINNGKITIGGDKNVPSAGVKSSGSESIWTRGSW